MSFPRESAILILAGLVACGRQQAERRNIVVLVDYSASVKADELEKHAGTIVQDVLGNLGPNDALEVFPIDAGAVTRHERLAAVDLMNHQPPFSQPNDGVTHREDSVRVRVAAFVQSLKDSVRATILDGAKRRRQFAAETDIIGALRGVADQHGPVDAAPTGFVGNWNRLAGRSKPRVTDVVILFSDMVNESADVNFARKAISTSEADSIISRLRRRDALPRLQGMVVFVSGRTGRDAAQVDAVRQFWQKFLAASGATVMAYDFDASPQVRSFLARQ